ncbi:MAG: recombinase family protein [Synergistaceae bacterium]|jgi:DNA invertase Pin-like site-specific DNA recombinase|nr:recombinase family protein [Synergistaceae bacterium]
MKQSNKIVEITDLKKLRGFKNIIDPAKIAALYVRLSRDDNLDGDSYSIVNQKKLLIEIANDKGYEYLLTFCDDGISGVTMNRPGFQLLLQAVELNIVSAVFVKDLSRLGRNYIEVGRLTEETFPEHDIRLVAVSDNLDTDEGDSELTPFKNLFNEWYARDISKKRRLSNKIKGNSGEPLSTKTPYGYMKDPANPKRWIVDGEAAAIVRRIYRMFMDGQGIERICVQFENEKVLTPSFYAAAHGIKVTGKKTQYSPYAWKHSAVSKILSLQEYCGDVINFKTYSKSYKNKKRHINPIENQAVFEGVHEAIIDRETWKQVQEKRNKTRHTRKPTTGEHNMFSGLLICSTCGTNLGFHFNQGNHDITYFNCQNYNNRGKQRGECDATHYIRTDFLEQVVLGDIARITAFTKHYEDEFIKILTDSTVKETERNTSMLEQELSTRKARNAELDVLFERIYEDSVNGKITEERFAKMSRKYEDEQAENNEKISALQKEIGSKAKKSGTANEFLAVVKRYTRIKKLTPEILQEFVDKIVVHHRRRVDSVDEQRIEIFYNCVGKIEIPDLKRIPQTEILIPTRKGVAISYSQTQKSAFAECQAI